MKLPNNTDPPHMVPIHRDFTRIECQTCGTALRMVASTKSKGTETRFCSRECRKKRHKVTR